MLMESEVYIGAYCIYGDVVYPLWLTRQRKLFFENCLKLHFT